MKSIHHLIIVREVENQKRSVASTVGARFSLSVRENATGKKLRSVNYGLCYNNAFTTLKIFSFEIEKIVTPIFQRYYVS